MRTTAWSYDRDLRFVDRNGGRLVSTPNGMLMGLGGNWIQGLFSLQGGTAWGDIFMANIVRCTDPCEQPPPRVRSGTRGNRPPWQALGEQPQPGTACVTMRRRHSANGAAKGYLRMSLGTTAGN